MSKTNWQDPGSSEIISPHISGLQEAVGKIEDAIELQTIGDMNVPLDEVYISDTDRYRIYQAPIGKRNWVAFPEPIIKKNGVQITSGFTIDYGGGAIILSPAATSSDVFTADAAYIIGAHSITPESIGAETPWGAQAKVNAHANAPDPHPQYATDADVNNLSNTVNSHLADYVKQPANGGTTGGTSTAYTCSSNPAPAALVDKIGVVITAHVDSGVNPTLDWNSLGAKPIKKPNGNAAVLKGGGIYTLRYNGSSGNFILQGEGASGNATASDLLSGKTASTDAGDIVGTMPNNGMGWLAARGISVAGPPGRLYMYSQPGYYNGTDGGLYADDANFIAANIPNGMSMFGLVGTGANARRMASGTVTLSSTNATFYSQSNISVLAYYATISGLTFTPSRIIIFPTVAETSPPTVVVLPTDFYTPSGGANSRISVSVPPTLVRYYSLDGVQAYISGGSFRIPVADGTAWASKSVSWIAYE